MPLYKLKEDYYEFTKPEGQTLQKKLIFAKGESIEAEMTKQDTYWDGTEKEMKPELGVSVTKEIDTTIPNGTAYIPAKQTFYFFVPMRFLTPVVAAQPTTGSTPPTTGGGAQDKKLMDKIKDNALWIGIGVGVLVLVVAGIWYVNSSKQR